MSLIVDDLPGTIRATKRELKAQLPEVKRIFAEVEEHMRREVDDIVTARERGKPVIPTIDFQAVRDGKVPDSVKQEIRRRGAAVIRGVFSREQAAAWNEAIGEYLARNRYHEKPADPSLDKYFSKLKSGRPQIFGIYWSKPQMEARQHPALAEVRAFLNRLWRHESEGA
ncbi:MAG TPA: YbiU family protein, partial [Dongiaceae bacterium]